MPFRPLSVICLCVLFSFSISAQEDPLRRIKNPGDKRSKKCGEFYEIVAKMPVDARTNVIVIDGNIYFVFRDEKYFKKIFNKRRDGIAIDIIDRSQFDCAVGNRLADSWAHRGELLPPIFRGQMKKRLTSWGNGVKINFGPIPEHFDQDSIECNLIVLQKRFHCSYEITSGLSYKDWGLLEMGLYRDSIPEKIPEEFDLEKRMTFTVPFEKDRAAFEIEDLRPLYDSLSLSDYDIQSIEIRAFTSVEGSTSHNKSLQHMRARSLVHSMEEFQKQKIPFSVSAIENWFAFFRDVHGTRFEYLATLKHHEIKKELFDLKDDETLEELLSPHRVGVITLTLCKKVSIFDDPDELVTVFAQKVLRKELEAAYYLQYNLFEQIKEEKLPDDLADRLEVPKTIEMGSLLVNDLVFRSSKDNLPDNELIKVFSELLELLPNNPMVKYNLAALKLRNSDDYSFAKDRKFIRSLIKSLRWKVEMKLYIRLLVNYNLMEARFFDQRNAYRHKNKAIRVIYQNYRVLDLTDDERLSLVGFLAGYSRFQWAEHVLTTRVYEEDVIPELLDYYFRLTFDESKHLGDQHYRQLVERSAIKYPEMFCGLFETKEKGGYSFQLLLNERLAQIYCETCN